MKAAQRHARAPRGVIPMKRAMEAVRLVTRYRSEEEFIDGARRLGLPLAEKNGRVIGIHIIKAEEWLDSTILGLFGQTAQGTATTGKVFLAQAHSLDGKP